MDRNSVSPNIIEPRSGCIATTLSVVGDKWTGLILRDLCEGAQRFGSLQSSLCGISPRTLSQRLDNLEDHGIISKHCFNEAPPRVEYKLTSKGIDLIPIIRAMADWGQKYQ